MQKSLHFEGFIGKNLRITAYNYRKCKLNSKLVVNPINIKYYARIARTTKKKKFMVVVADNNRVIDYCHYIFLSSP